jgi:hypothetical protein
MRAGNDERAWKRSLNAHLGNVPGGQTCALVPWRGSAGGAVGGLVAKALGTASAVPF